MTKEFIINTLEYYSFGIEQLKFFDALREKTFIRLLKAKDVGLIPEKEFQETITDINVSYTKDKNAVRMKIDAANKLINSPELTDQERELLRYRYCDQATWELVADKLHYSYRGCWHIYNRALAKLEKSY